MKRGDYVKTCVGGVIVLGRVIRAGSATYTVRWESGAENRCTQSYRGVELVTDPDLLDIAKRSENLQANPR